VRHETGPPTFHLLPPPRAYGLNTPRRTHRGHLCIV